MRRTMLLGILISGLSLAAPLEGTLWSLQQTNPGPPTLTLYQGKAYGYSGCNRYNTTYRLRAGQMVFGPIRSTLMLCTKAGQQIEAGFLSVLRQGPVYQLRGDQLVLSTKAGTLNFSAPKSAVPQAKTPKPVTVAKPAEPKPTKPEAVKPVEVKPVEVKPVEVKPVEVKPVEVKPPAPPKPPAPMVKALQVGPNTVNCTTTDITQCLLVRDSETQPWTLLAEPIEGFEFKEGLQHGVRVEITPDGTQYKLLRLLGQKPVATRLRIWEVSPEQVDCQGMVAQQKCLQVRTSQDEFWQNFFDPIEGFEFQEGKGYTLLVEVSPIENPPMDASNQKYKLVSVLETR